MKIVIKVFACLFLMLGTLFTLPTYAFDCVSWQPGTFAPTHNAQGQKLPSYGLYWFSTESDDNMTSTQHVMAACTTDDPKAKASCMANLQQHGYFNPNHPTIIFIHGWQPGAVLKHRRFDFCYQYVIGPDQLSPIYNTLKPWAGWNVGVFYWNQFADENDVKVAESKIYTTQGRKGMRWAYEDKIGLRSYCAGYDTSCVVPKGTIVDMAYQAILQGMPASNDYHGAELRIAGHSLGTQIAIQLTQRMFTDNTTPQPTRLDLMDPYFSPDYQGTWRNHLPDSVADYNTDIVSKIIAAHPTFPIAVYRTSNASFAPWGNPGWNLVAKVAYTRLNPNAYMNGLTSLTLLGADHNSAAALYFISKAFPAPKAPTSKAKTAPVENYINANSTNAQVLALMGQRRYEEATTLVTDTKLKDSIPAYAQTWKSRFTDKVPENLKDQ